MKTPLLWSPVLAILLAGCGASEAVNVSPAGRASDRELPWTGRAVVSNRRVDDFGLPLEIQIDAPEPPKEIVGPSPPIKSDKPAEQKTGKAK